MEKLIITQALLRRYEGRLRDEEKSAATVDKYMREARRFARYAGAREANKGVVLAYKSELGRAYPPKSANSMLAALNSLLRFAGRNDLSVRQFRLQKETYRSESAELTREEYFRLVSAAEQKGDTMTSLLLQTVCCTGIRVSELGFVTAEFLFAKHPDAPEGELTRVRALLVCEDSLHEVAQRLGLGRYLKLGHGEESGGGRERASILADATEAVFAAVYLDGGIDVVRALIHRVLLSSEREDAAERKRRDYKTLLQEYVQRTPGRTLSYRMAGESGPDHAKTFAVEVLLDGQTVGMGSGRSKKEAEQMAARDAMERMQGK